MDNLYYSRDHVWVRVEGKRAVVGISEFARSELGEVSYVELPASGKRVARGEVVCSIDSLKSASDIYAPLSGTVAESNSRLAEESGCALVNDDPWAGAGSSCWRWRARRSWPSCWSRKATGVTWRRAD